MRLTYIGDGRWIAGVPARDLTDDEVRRCTVTIGELVGSGIYTEAGRRAKRTVEPDIVVIEQGQNDEQETGQ